eukprot:CAMPEP_0113271354 /NCGR_PEP_ID=MMETSP0008_2-20120614/22727_1 /TAXON_ID=97485 /ORGANISM="Prymnesium parvum" /LENGTH=36 /DNA_ID=CAMNT_0000120707 /DNA_START=165 /DNA_END=272 /DNA_ORIENTATION=+ /assembly_acc=CAM_ASM_000153
MASWDSGTYGSYAAGRLYLTSAHEPTAERWMLPQSL